MKVSVSSILNVNEQAFISFSNLLLITFTSVDCSWDLLLTFS